jgi:hypothetical protein
MALAPFTNTWGQEEWSRSLLEALIRESALLNSPVTMIHTDAKVVHVPRLALHPTAGWTAELAELPSDAGQEDVIALTPRKIGNVVQLSNESIEDASVDVLNSMGRGMARGLSHALDATAFGNSAETATTPAGLLYDQNVTTVATLSAASGTSATTSLSIQGPDSVATPAGGLTMPLADGASITVTDPTGAHNQTFTLNAAGADGDTTLTIVSATPGYNYPIGSTVTFGPGALAPDETVGGVIDVDAILDGVGSIEGFGGQANAIYLSAYDLTQLRKAKATTNQYLLAPGGQVGDLSQRPVEMIAGAQCFVSPGITKGTVLVADSRFIQVAIRRDIEVAFSTENAFTSDSVVARVTARLDWALGDRNAMYYISASS